jgi:hypothetical protein
MSKISHTICKIGNFEASDSRDKEESAMKKTMFFSVYFVLVMCFTSVCAGSSCPGTKAELERECEKATKEIEDYEIWEQFVNDSQYLFFELPKFPEEDTTNYEKRFTRTENLVEGDKPMFPVRGKYFDPKAKRGFVVITQEEFTKFLVYLMNTIPELTALDMETQLQKMQQLEETVEKISNTVKNKKFRGSQGELAKWGKSLQKVRHFHSRCCQELQPQSGDGINLLDVSTDEQ